MTRFESCRRWRTLQLGIRSLIALIPVGRAARLILGDRQTANGDCADTILIGGKNVFGAFIARIGQRASGVAKSFAEGCVNGRAGNTPWWW